MPTENDLRMLLTHEAMQASPIDTAAVIRRSRRHRRSRQLALGGALGLAVVGVAFVGFGGILPMPQTASTSTTAEGGERALDESQQLEGASGAQSGPAPENYSAENYSADAQSAALSACGELYVAPPPAANGLSLSPNFAASAPLGAQSVSGTVTLQNSGATTIAATSPAAPSLTLSREGVTVWSGADSISSGGVEISLAPGESRPLAASFAPLSCASVSGEGLPAGTYELTASILVTPHDPAEAPYLVSGPAQSIELR